MRRKSGQDPARAMIPTSVTFLHPPRLMPCNLDAEAASCNIDSSDTSATLVRSNATRLGQHGRTLLIASSESAAHPTSVSRSRRVHAAILEKSKSLISLARATKLSLRINDEYANVDSSSLPMTVIILNKEDILVTMGLCHNSSTLHSHHILETRRHAYRSFGEVSCLRA